VRSDKTLVRSGEHGRREWGGWWGSGGREWQEDENIISESGIGVPTPM